jgi:SAM-dependent methyltransferase
MVVHASYVCPRCHGGMEIGPSGLICPACTITYPVADGIADFSEGHYYDQFDPSSSLTVEHQAGLNHEVEGSRWRIQAYYLPKIETTLRKFALERSRIQILDCGCGNGWSVDLLNDTGLLTWGVDLSQLRRWQWRERKHKGNLAVADARRLPFEDGRFHFILCSGVIEHIGVQEYKLGAYSVKPLENRDAMRTAFLSELLRVLAPGGTLWLDCPNGAFPIDFWHGDRVGQARRHALNEGFLAKTGEIRSYLSAIKTPASLKPRSPHRLFRFQQVGRHWYGRAIRPLMGIYFNLMRVFPFSILAGTGLNPYLVLEISKEADHVHSKEHSTAILLIKQQ